MFHPARRTSLLIAIFALAGSLAPAAPTVLDSSVALARKQAALADQALRDLETLVKSDQLSKNDPKFGLWERRKIEALRASEAGKDELIAALTRYLDRMKRTEEYTAQLFRGGEASRIDVHDAEYRRLEAEIWLNKEQTR